MKETLLKCSRDQQRELSCLTTPCQLQTQQDETHTLQVQTALAITLLSQKEKESFPSHTGNSPASERMSQCSE